MGIDYTVSSPCSQWKSDCYDYMTKTAVWRDATSVSHSQKLSKQSGIRGLRGQEGEMPWEETYVCAC